MNTKATIRSLLAGIFTLGLSASCLAIPLTLSFNITDFYPGTHDPISGTIGYDAATETSSIDSLTSVDLAIEGYTFGVGDLSFSNSGSESTITGTEPGAGGFSLIFDYTTGTGIDFTYSFASGDSYSAKSFSSFDRSVTVPEPAPLAIMGLGLALIGAVYRKKS